ncbi:MAG: PASTA domain-containing protein, partial [Nocardioidaceae bacterium]
LVARATSRHRDLRPADAHVMLQQLRRVRQALDSGVTDDPELTDDLTPTLAIHSDVGMLASYAGAGSSTGGAARSVDEVFDQELYADRLPRSEHTLIVGDPILPESLFGGSTPSTGDDRAASWSSPGLPDVPPTANPPPAKRKRRKSGWIAFVLVLLLAAAAGVGAWYYSAGRFQSTPNIISLSERAAQAKLTRSGLHFAISRVAYSETVPSGEVIATNPGPGDQVAKHGTVRAVISKGPERHAVPTVEGFGERRAVATIAASHLKVGHITRVWSEKVKRGQVISNSPTAGVSLRRDSPVALVVSRGPKPIPIHNYTGTPADNAQSQLKRLGFHVLAKWRYDDNVPAGKVIRQNPRNGNGHRGDTILLRVSRGPHLVDVPDVLRSGVDAAKSTLTAAGFHVDERQYTPYLGWGIVAGESPHGGQAPFGSTVIIYVL